MEHPSFPLYRPVSQSQVLHSLEQSAFNREAGAEGHSDTAIGRCPVALRLPVEDALQDEQDSWGAHVAVAPEHLQAGPRSTP